MDSATSIKSYLSPKIVIDKSNIHGLGMFAELPIKQDEIAFIKAGHVLTRNELFFSKQINSYLPIDDNFFIGAGNEKEEDRIKLFLNHSCEPNCGVRGEITFIALRDIQKAEELTCDYAMIDNEDYEFDCNCGSFNCRSKITGYDWKLKTLQYKYANNFSRYLIKKIRDKSLEE